MLLSYHFVLERQSTNDMSIVTEQPLQTSSQIWHRTQGQATASLSMTETRDWAPAYSLGGTESVYADLASLAHEETVILKLKQGSFGFLRPKHRLTVFSTAEEREPLYVFADDDEGRSGFDCCSGEAGFTLAMKDAADGHDVLLLEETQKGCGGFDNTVDGVGIQYLDANTRGAIPIGYVQKTSTCCAPSFGVCDASGRPVLWLESVVACCGGIEFALRQYEGGVRIGSVSQEFGGCCSCSNSATLVISFPMHLDVTLKACVIAGAVLLLYYAVRAAARRQQEA